MYTKLKSHFLTTEMIEPIDITLIHASSIPLREGLVEIDSLIRSIAQHGLLQPIIVRPKGRFFEIVAGHRRFEACRALKRKHIPSIIVDVDDKNAYEIALVENLQRGSLDLIEEAKAYRKYVNEYGWGGVSELAKKIGMSEEYVSHRMHLLTLPGDVLKLISSRELNYSVARELVWIKDPKQQTLLANKVIREKMSSRDVRRIAQGLTSILWNYSPSKLITKDDRAFSKATVTLKVAMIRIDSLMEDSISEKARERLLEVRSEIHRLIDELLRGKYSTNER